MKDTIRILLAWKCNLACSYCCNEQPEVRQRISPVALRDIDFSKYRVLCISGGEPLLFPESVQEVCGLAFKLVDRIVLYTNGMKLSGPLARQLADWGVSDLNIGLHYPAMFDLLISRVSEAVAFTSMGVRFHVEDIHAALLKRYAALNFRLWHRDDCTRDNEEVVILENSVDVVAGDH